MHFNISYNVRILYGTLLHVSAPWCHPQGALRSLLKLHTIIILTKMVVKCTLLPLKFKLEAVYFSDTLVHFYRIDVPLPHIPKSIWKQIKQRSIGYFFFLKVAVCFPEIFRIFFNLPTMRFEKWLFPSSGKVCNAQAARYGEASCLWSRERKAFPTDSHQLVYQKSQPKTKALSFRKVYFNIEHNV